MIITRKILVFIFVLLFTDMFAQTNVEIPNLTLPSPTAYHLGEYGQENVGLFTGTTQVSVPLGNYRTSNLDVPIYLGYSSNGVKVDQISSNVGLDWNLVAGGVITRIVRDEPDDQRNYLFPEKEISDVGVYSPIAMDFFYEAGRGEFDTERDLYSFNFSGHSGRFVVDNNKKIVQIPKSSLKIETVIENDIRGFQITTPVGVKYIFLEEEESFSRISGAGHSEQGLIRTTAWYLSRIEHPKGDIINFIYGSNQFSYTVSESQTFIVPFPSGQYVCGTTAGGPVVYPGNDISLKNNLRHVGKELLEINSNSPSSGSVTFSNGIHHPTLGFGLIDKIIFNNSEKITVESIRLNYLLTQNQRVFLKEVVFSDPDKKYNFVYDDPEGFPSRLSKSQDHWGYYNGKTNSSYWFPNPKTLGQNIPNELKAHNIGADKSPNYLFAKKGLLKKVTYPTKGSTNFEHEENSESREELNYPPKDIVRLFQETNSSQMGEFSDEKTVFSPMKQEIEILAGAHFNSYVCSQNFDVKKSKVEFSIQEVKSGNFINLYKYTSLGGRINLGKSYLVGPDNSENLNAQLEKGKNYKFKITLRFNCIYASARISYYKDPAEIIQANVPSGGLRLKSIVTKGSDDQQNSHKKIYYGKKESLTISSANPGVRPYYLSKNIERKLCQNGQGGYYNFNYLHLSSNSIRNLYKTQGVNSTYYEFVTISYGGESFEKGGEEHQFIVNSDYPGNPLYGEPIEESPYTNFGWDNGFLKKKLSFKKGSNGGFINVRKTENFYKKDIRLYDEVYAYSIRKKYERTGMVSGDITYECTEKDLNRKHIQSYCAADHSHWWSTTSGKCYASGSNNKLLVIPHPCFGGTLPKTIVYPELIDNLDIQEYKTLSNWTYLDYQTRTDYDEDGIDSITTEEKYLYDNPDHMQISRTEIINSKGEKVIKSLLYSEDIKDSNSMGHHPLTLSELEAVNKMKKNRDNLIGIPIQITDLVTNTNDTVSKVVHRTNFSIYKGMVLPKDIEVLKGTKNFNISSDVRLIYKRYNLEGNPVEISHFSGPTTVYIWGYNGQYPIARIENATYSDVASALNVDKDYLDTFNEQNLEEIDFLRNKLSLKESAITTYTYEPLVGLRSTTDPKGLTTYYEYDAFNRLEFIKDQDQNIISEYGYHYKTQN
ncbi:hypothetical protein OQ279_14910 [Salinimicrobium sp. MT39]|uniref:RHS repeat protein n=1 Tax=Salinimicrobium profundisediminis TaxID=2994553 RepID=A0A9X3D198_9FLAO|nr:hypothetical protein [Salinimicrobium profundisediminis]MCX2839439.1 hypothetical protein [Salinimicrobium profundisediminis]